MLKDVFGMMLTILIVFAPIFILISRLFKRYNFTNRYINIVLLFVMTFGSPLAIIGVWAGLSILGFSIFNSSVYIKTLIFILVAPLIALLRYKLWIFLSDDIGVTNLLVFSKRYIFQILYLPIAYYFVLAEVEEMPMVFLIIFLTASVFAIPIYLTIKEKYLKW
ncbi:MAG: hypothetical protein AB7D29_05795 [Campylobacterales bacterium]